ncbi:MAG: helix-turn-helix domain-containing protein [Deltaproteobacteria bacterium]|jgi:DNA-binding XRE family transcriptional regulator|nr:helix-turn-helix domain-containing protein [Deltaproteobacteria bacterium]
MKVNGAAFKKARESLLLGTNHLAKVADLSPSCIKNLENGGNLRLGSIRKVIAALGLTIEDAYDKKLIED